MQISLGTIRAGLAAGPGCTIWPWQTDYTIYPWDVLTPGLADEKAAAAAAYCARKAGQSTSPVGLMPSAPVVPTGVLEPGLKTSAGLPVGSTPTEVLNQIIDETDAATKAQLQAYYDYLAGQLDIAAQQAAEDAAKEESGFPWTTVLLAAGGIVVVVLLVQRRR